MEILKREEVDEKYKWDLTNLIKDEDTLNSLCNKEEELLKEVLSYKDRIMESADSLYNFLVVSDQLQRIHDKLYVYVSLKLDEDSSDVNSQSLNERIKRILEESQNKLSFIMPEILRTDKNKVLKYLEEKKELKEYEFDLEKVYRRKDHVLDEKLESVISKVEISTSNSSDIYYYLNNTDAYYDNIIDENGEEVKLTSSNYSVFLESKDRNVRKQAFKKMYKFWGEHKNTVAALYKAKISECLFYSEIRNFNSTIERYLFPDKISISVYENLIKSVHSYLGVMDKYQAFKKKMLGLDEMHFYDMYLSIVKVPEKEYSFSEAKDIVIDALSILGEEYISDLKKAFDNKWIDVMPNIGKKTGAYQWGCYDSNPFVLLNFSYKVGDVSTLAHELGHAMHSYYSNKNQSYVYSDYSIFLAEIASTVNEVLLNDYLYRNSSNKEDQAYYINELLELIKSTIFRQTQFAEFEYIMHKKYQNKEVITSNVLCDEYYELNKKYYGNSIYVDEEIRYEWERIPHFYTPFYVYKYATGLACALDIASRILKKEDGALERYLNFLKSGCSKDPLDILHDAGVQLESGKPVVEALKVFESKLEELIKSFD